MKPRYQLDAFLEDSGKRVPLRLEIWPPEKTKGENDYFCRVKAGELLSGEKKIFGAQADQAYELAQGFIRSLLKDKKLVDAKGRVLELFANK